MKVVAVGGGHGLAATLKAVRAYATEITAVVAVADDGGSTGRLRDAFDVPAPGDVRRCLLALAADPTTAWARAFEHRFERGDVAGHPLGNLVIAALAEVTGDFVTAVDEAARLLGTAGRVLPATTEPVVLVATTADGRRVVGQVAIKQTSGIVAVGLDPPDAEPPPAAIDAIAAADQIVLGPGSLYTSVLAAVAVPGIAAAIAASPAMKIYVANLGAEAETDGYDTAAHVAALRVHGVEPDAVVSDSSLARANGRSHDPARLGAVLAGLGRVGLNQGGSE